MNFLRKLTVGIVLMFVLGVGTATGQTNSAGCVPPQPGISETPPCAAANQTSDDSETLGQTNTPPAANMADETSFTDLALDVIERLLFLF
jgi:hypothetical protein